MSEKNISFFAKLRKGVVYVETEVQQLKQLADNGFHRSCDQTIEQDLQKAKQFDRDLRQTYVEVTTLYNEMKGSDMHLNEVEQHIQGLSQALTNIENNSGLKNYGYKPWINEELVHNYTSNQLTDNFNINRNNGSVVDFGCETTISSNVLINEMTQRTDGSDGQTRQTVQYMPSDNQQMNTNVINIENKKLNKYLGRTPQPYDFGLTTRRQTLVPQLFLNNNNNNNNNSNNNNYNNYNKYRNFDKSPEPPNFDSSATNRFNYLTSSLNDFNLRSVANTRTPPKASCSSVNGADSFVTVEFTPGLTTKRPKGISRVECNRKEDGTESHSYFRRCPQVLQSVENEKITPEQPIPSTNASKSAKLFKSLSNSRTPPLPQTRINSNLHNKLLKKK